MSIILVLSRSVNEKNIEEYFYSHGYSFHVISKNNMTVRRPIKVAGTIIRPEQNTDIEVCETQQGHL
jgi:hypothetical protein